MCRRENVYKNRELKQMRKIQEYLKLQHASFEGNKLQVAIALTEKKMAKKIQTTRPGFHVNEFIRRV
jgi:LytS/YehU family sensor histidine kinase